MLLSQYIEIAIQTRQVLSLGLENKNNTSEKGIGYCAHIRQRKISYYDPFPKVNYVGIGTNFYSNCLPAALGMDLYRP